MSLKWPFGFVRVRIKLARLVEKGGNGNGRELSLRAERCGREGESEGERKGRRIGVRERGSHNV